MGIVVLCCPRLLQSYRLVDLYWPTSNVPIPPIFLRIINGVRIVHDFPNSSPPGFQLIRGAHHTSLFFDWLGMFANRAQEVVQNIVPPGMVLDLNGATNLFKVPGVTWQAKKSAVLMLLWSKHWQAGEAGVVSTDSAHPDNLKFLCETKADNGLCDSVLAYEVQRMKLCVSTRNKLLSATP